MDGYRAISTRAVNGDPIGSAICDSASAMVVSRSALRSASLRSVEPALEFAKA
jgi:hypothetical protein